MLYRPASSFSWPHGAEPAREVTIDGEVFQYRSTEFMIKPMYPPLISDNRTFTYVALSGHRLLVIEGL